MNQRIQNLPAANQSFVVEVAAGVPAVDLVLVLDRDAAHVAKLVQCADERGPVDLAIPGNAKTIGGAVDSVTVAIFRERLGILGVHVMDAIRIFTQGTQVIDSLPGEMGGVELQPKRR